jgi:hypothetical protein
MKAFTKYRHIRCVDVDLVCLRVVESTIDYFVVRGYLTSRHYNINYDIENFTIRREDMPNWKEL